MSTGRIELALKISLQPLENLSPAAESMGIFDRGPV
jgi:hypothetical protein